jgi:hypothetical protein
VLFSPFASCFLTVSPSRFLAGWPRIPTPCRGSLVSNLFHKVPPHKACALVWQEHTRAQRPRYKNRRIRLSFSSFSLPLVSDSPNNTSPAALLAQPAIWRQIRFKERKIPRKSAGNRKEKKSTPSVAQGLCRQNTLQTPSTTLPELYIAIRP